MKCRDLLELKSFDTIDLVAGENGLDHVITWVYINQDTSVGDWIHGGELVFLTGMETAYEENTLLEICRECIEYSVAGIVILICNEYIGKIPEVVIELADIKKMPLFRMPWNLKLVDVTKEIANTIIVSQLQEKSASKFFYELLFNEIFSSNSVKSMALHCGVDIEQPAMLMVFRPIIKQSEDPNKRENVLVLFQRKLDDLFRGLHINAIAYIFMDEILVFSNLAEENECEKVIKEIKILSKSFINKFSEVNIFGGVGELCTDISYIRFCYKEAKQSLIFSEQSGSNVAVHTFSEMGVLRLIINKKDVVIIEGYCYDTLKPLIDFDNKKSTEYLKTLKVYLKNNCSLVKAAEELFIHRNTMVYRVDKLKEFLHTDFEDMYVKAELINALKLLEYYSFDTTKMTNGLFY